MFKVKIQATNEKIYTIIANSYKQAQLWLKQLSSHAAIVSVKAIRQTNKGLSILTYNGSFKEVCQPV